MTKIKFPLFIFKSAFTFAEVIVALSIMVLVLVSVLSTYYVVTNLSDVESIRIKEFREASIIMDKLVRGLAGNDGLREAVSYTINTPSDISFILPGGTVRRFYLTGDKIFLGPSNILVGEDVGSLNVSGTSKFINIDITFSKPHRGKTYVFRLSELVKARN